MRKVMKKFAVLGLTLVLAMVFVTGCGNSSSSSASNTSDSDTKSSDGGKDIKVAAIATYAPFIYQKEDGSMDGFEAQVIYELDKRMEDYTFTFEATEWNSLLPGLDSNRWQMVASNVGYTEERDDLYTCSEPYCGEELKLLVNSDKHGDWKTIDDVTGTIVLTSGTIQSMWLESYLEKHKGQFEIKYIDGLPEQFIEEVSSGQSDCTVDIPPAIYDKCETMGISNIKEIGDAIDILDLCMWFADNDEGNALNEAIAPYLKEMVEDGTISKLSQEYLGYDCVEPMQKDGYWKDVTIAE